MVLFIGDRPSKFNAIAGQAFIGTQSYKVLQKWAVALDLKDFAMLNSEEVDLPHIIRFYSTGNQLVALGNKASKVLQQLGFNHFKLPHPSGRNRQLNDGIFVTQKLKECKQYLNV